MTASNHNGNLKIKPNPSLLLRRLSQSVRAVNACLFINPFSVDLIDIK